METNQNDQNGSIQDQNVQESISKNQMKKKEKKIQQKVHEKQKKKEKKIARKEAQSLYQLSKQQDQDNKIDKPIEVQEPTNRINKKTKKVIYKEMQTQGLKVIIDLQFLDQMREKEQVSLFKQTELCHSLNFKSEKPLNLIVTSTTEVKITHHKQKSFKQLLDTANCDNWGIQITDKHYLDLYNKENLIYLSGDSQDDMDVLDTSKTYIIGGLVDHNRLKDITQQKAIEQGIKTMRFPITQNLSLKSSTILTVNQVFEILLRLQNGEDWAQALDHSIPKRKKIE